MASGRPVNPEWNKLFFQGLSSMPAKLSPSEIEQALAGLSHWRVEDGKLHRELTFPDFISAFGFMTVAALLAESRGHHPDWFNHYNVVRIWLVTNSLGGISDLDVELAARIEEAYEKFK